MRPSMIEQIKAAAKDKPDHIGVRLGLLCLRGEVPLSFVQGVVGTTHVSVYRWVTGETNPQNKADIRKLTRLIYTITEAIERGILPQEKFSPDPVLPLWKQSRDSI